MQRLFSPAAIGAALVAVCASSAAWSAEVDFNTLAVPPEPEQSSAPAQVWTLPNGANAANAANDANDASTGSAPSPVRREEGVESGGAMFMPFSSASTTPPPSGNAAAPHGQASKASQGSDGADVFLTLFALLAGVGALAWLVRRA